MRSRRRKSSPFSLFSFQDIITSVTAVIILITLILALELVTRQPTSAAGQLDESATALRSALEQADQERRALESRLQQEAASTLEQASTTPKLLQSDFEQTHEQVVKLQRELEQLRQRQNAAEQQEDAVLAQSLDRNVDRKELEDLKTKASEAEIERKQIVEGNQLIFNRPSGISKRPWLVDVSEDGIVVLSLGTDGAHYEFRSRLLNSCTDQLVAWARTNCSAQDDYFVLLVRPSGLENAEALRASLSNRGFDIGRDIVGSTQKVSAGRAKLQ